MNINFSKKLIYIFGSLSLLLIFNFFLPAFSSSPYETQVNQRIETRPEDIPKFNAPVCLLVGLYSSELSYRELSGLGGFELYSVPYRSDIKELVGQIKPTQIVIKHPSGFVGLYTKDGALIRGVETVTGNQTVLSPQIVPPSIIQPTNANPYYPGVQYPGSQTGGIPHGGVGYVEHPKGRNISRHLLKLATVTSLVPYQYPGFFNYFSPLQHQDNLFPYLIISNIPYAVNAINTTLDSRYDEKSYAEARTQPRDYKFQPVIEGY